MEIGYLENITLIISFIISALGATILDQEVKQLDLVVQRYPLIKVLVAYSMIYSISRSPRVASIISLIYFVHLSNLVKNKICDRIDN